MVQPVSYLKEGSCYHVLNHIQKQTQNDSLTVEYFKDYYKINSLSSEQISKLFEKKTSEIFDYFKSNQHIKCYLKRLKKDPVLLDNREK
jgi:spore coat polysaccharide biosynthesis protein SpsF (cytidylyltransferase family)